MPGSVKIALSRGEVAEMLVRPFLLLLGTSPEQLTICMICLRKALGVLLCSQTGRISCIKFMRKSKCIRGHAAL